MKAEIIPCPCGCKKFLVPPIINHMEDSMRREEAEELVRRWNHFEPKLKGMDREREEYF